MDCEKSLPFSFDVIACTSDANRSSLSFRYQLAAGSALWTVGIFTLSVSTTYTQIFLSQAVCLGVSEGTLELCERRS